MFLKDLRNSRVEDSVHLLISEYLLRFLESGINEHWKTLLHKQTCQINLHQMSIMKEDLKEDQMNVEIKIYMF